MGTAAFKLCAGPADLRRVIPSAARIRRTGTALVAVLLALPAAASAAGPPQPRSLNGSPWVFAADPHDSGRADQWQNGHFRGRPVTLPHVTDLRETRAGYAGSVGWYRTAISAPAPQAGAGWAIRFEQARRVADVWLDGRRLAHHEGSYEPFEVPADALGDGRPHTLVVRTDNRLRPGRRPDGWWNWGGLTRAVTLVPRGVLDAHDSAFLPERRCDPAAGTCSWTVLVDTTVENTGAVTMTPLLTGTLDGPDSVAAGRASVRTRPLAPGEQAHVRFRVPVTGTAALWSPQRPQRYTATLAVHDGAAPATTVATEKARIGLRTVAVEDGLLAINDEPVQLRGASIHEDEPGHGPALTDQDVRQIVAHLKAIGANVTRAHYALDPRLLDALDAAGILVWAQAPVYHRDDELATAAGREEALRTLRSAVIQTRNHPAVITHSVANELSVTPDARPGTRAYLDAALDATRELDPTLPVAVDLLSYPGLTRQETYGRFDLLGLNTYFGWYPGPRNRSTADIGGLAPFVRHMRELYPRAGLVMTEFGAEATEGGPADKKQTYAFQARYIADTMRLAAGLPQLSGAIYWSLQEFTVKPAWDGGAQTDPRLRTATHHKGVLTRDWERKPGWDALRRAITGTPMIRGARDVELATGIHQPLARSGQLGALTTIALVLLVLALLVADLWAFRGWRRDREREQDELIEAALALPLPAPLPALALTLVQGHGTAATDDERSGARVA